MVKDNQLLGQLRLHDIPSAPQGTLKIEVTLEVDFNYNILVSAEEKESGIKAQMSVAGENIRLTDENLGRIALEALQYAEEDEKMRRLAEDIFYGGGSDESALVVWKPFSSINGVTVGNAATSMCNVEDAQ